VTPADASNSLCLSPCDVTTPPAHARTWTSARRRAGPRLVGLADLRQTVVGSRIWMRPVVDAATYIRRPFIHSFVCLAVVLQTSRVLMDVYGNIASDLRPRSNIRSWMSTACPGMTPRLRGQRIASKTSSVQLRFNVLRWQEFCSQLSMSSQSTFLPSRWHSFSVACSSTLASRWHPWTDIQ